MDDERFWTALTEWARSPGAARSPRELEGKGRRDQDDPQRSKTVGVVVGIGGGLRCCCRLQFGLCTQDHRSGDYPKPHSGRDDRRRRTRTELQRRNRLRSKFSRRSDGQRTELLGGGQRYSGKSRVGCTGAPGTPGGWIAESRPRDRRRTGGGRDSRFRGDRV